jgi:Concanavalin A-like lectin/glucanases superfamily
VKRCISILALFVSLPCWAGRSFNGTSDIIIVPAVGNALDLSSGPMTISFWFYPTVIPTSGSHYPIAHYASNGGQFAVGFGACSGGCSSSSVLGYLIGTYAAETGVFGSCGVYTANAWYQVTIFVDTAGTIHGSPTAGQIVSGGDSCSTFTAFRENRVAGAGNFDIGGIEGAADFQGIVAEVGVWNALLSPAEMSALQTVCPASIRRTALVGYFPLWGASGTSIEPDLSGNRNNGALTGTGAANHAPCKP